MKRSVIGMSAAAVLLCATAVWAQEQGQGQGGRGRGGPGFWMGMGGGPREMPQLQLAQVEAVQKELALTEDQVAKLRAMYNEAQDDLRAQLPAPGDFRNLPPEERQKSSEKMREVLKKVTEKFQPRIAEALDAKQRERLQQIAWHVAGTRALRDPEVAKRLELSPEQQDKLAAIAKEFEQKQAEMGRGGFNGDFQERLAKARELGENRDKQSQEVLTAEQRDKFAQLKGKEFDVTLVFRGGPGAPGGPGGQGRPPRRPAAE